MLHAGKDFQSFILNYFFLIACDLYSLFNNQEMQLIEATIAAVKKNGKNNKINDIIGCEMAGFTKLYIYIYTIFGLRV